MTNGQRIQPILILPEGTRRTAGRDAQRINIMAARMVAEAVKSTLGPRGMDKMLVDSLGDVTITNDGVTILEEMEIEHPAAKMVVEVAKVQRDEVGDGTTTAVVLAGELLAQAESLLDQKIHPTIITHGFRMAGKKALEILDALSQTVSENDVELLEQIAMTAMTGKHPEHARKILAELIVKAVKQVAERHDGKLVIDTDHVKLEKVVGGSLEDTNLVNGVVLDKEVVHPGMPKRVKNAKIALIDAPLEVKSTETDAKIQISSPEQLKQFLDAEEEMLREIVTKIAEVGANVVLCQKGIDDLAQHLLAKAGVLAVRRVKKSDMERLARSTGAKIVTNIKDLASEDLGNAGLVEEKKIGGEKMLFVQECKNPKAVTLLIRGGTEHVVDEAERAIEDAVDGVAAALELGKIVAGGGASEISVAVELRKYAQTVGGREQLAIEAFAKAMEIIPRALAENAGLDPIDFLVKLKSMHEQGNSRYGLDLFAGEVKDMIKLGVIEPLKIKRQAVKSASEVAEMVLRIDDVIAASGMKESEPKGTPSEAEMP